MQNRRVYNAARKTAGVVVSACEESPLAWLLRDHDLTQEERQQILANYFNDIYHLFLAKIIHIYDAPYINGDDEEKIRMLFEELLKVKRMLEGKT